MGSILAGSADYIKEARRWRKMVGSLRQSGVFAAAGIVALQEMVDRLAEDTVTPVAWRKAWRSPGLAVDPTAVETNIIMVHVADEGTDPQEFVAAMAEQGVKVGSPWARIRIVTHYQFRAEDVDVVLRGPRRAVPGSRPRLSPRALELGRRAGARGPELPWGPRGLG